MRLAIADPPYFGRARRWYGDGRGNQGGQGRADFHPDAALWDTAAAHQKLVHHLEQYDGWAVAMAPDSLPLYLEVAPPEARVAVWHKSNATPSRGSVISSWEPVLYVRARVNRGNRPSVRDVLTFASPRQGFPGAKPAVWTSWIRNLMGYEPGDTVDDLFPGSGAVSAALTQEVII